MRRHAALLLPILPVIAEKLGARLEELGGASPDTTPATYTAFIRDERAAFTPLVRAAGPQPQ